MGVEELQAAWELLKEAYQYQMGGDYDMAVELYKRSLDLHPTAEAFTFLGWTHRLQGKIDDAIAECKKAIQVDPDFGTPYNDIGAYLIEKGELDEAIPWLEKATCAARYDNPCFPHFNLGRVWEMKHDYPRALQAYRTALDVNPRYTLAKTALRRIQARFN